MEKAKKIVERSLQAWKRASSEVRREAKKTYKQISEFIQENPDLEEKTSTVLLNIYALVVEGRYIEALGFLSVLAFCLLHACRRSKESK